MFFKKFDERPFGEELKNFDTILEEKREKFEILPPRLKPTTLVLLKPNSRRKTRMLVPRLKRILGWLKWKKRRLLSWLKLLL